MPVEPRRTDYQSVPRGLEDHPLPCELGAPVHADGARLVRLPIWPVARAIEHVIRADVHHAGADPLRRSRNVSRSRRVDVERRLAIALGAVDVRVGGAVDHDIRSGPRDERVGRHAVPYVELSKVGRGHVELSLKETHQLRPQHSGRTRDQNPRPAESSLRRLTSHYGTSIRLASPTMKRKAFGIVALLVISTSLPIRLFSILLPRFEILEFSSTMLCSISEFWTVTS